LPRALDPQREHSIRCLNHAVHSVVPNVAKGMVRAATSEPALGKQAARFGSRGEDFAIAHRLQ
jgi:hypothetical protein